MKITHTPPPGSVTRRAFCLLAAPLVLACAAPLAAQDKDPIAEYLWEKRLVLIFADSPRDPRLARQLKELDREPEELDARDVVVIVDSEPGPSRFDTTALRRKFRPQGFNVLLVDKDGAVKMRRPVVVTAYDVMRMIDRTPLRQQELGRR